VIHRLVPTAILVTVVAAPLLGMSWNKSVRVDVGGVSFPLLTVVFVIAWALGAGVAVLRSPKARVDLGVLLVPWAAWLAWAGFGMWRAGFTGGGIAYLIAWAAFPVLGWGFATRWPMRESDTRYWVRCMGLLGLATLVAPRGMLLVPANVNLTALILVPGFTMALFFAFERRSKGAALIAAFIALALVVATRRSALAACAFAGALAFAGLDARRKLRLGVLVPLVLLYLGVFTALFFEDFTAMILDRLASVGLAYDTSVETSDTRRAELTGQAIEVWKSHPVLGVGHGRYLRHLASLGVDDFLLARPHNIVLISLAENGTPGAALLVATLALPAALAWRRTEAGTLGRYWGITYAACCVYLLGNDYVHSPGFWPVFAAMVAASYASPLDAPKSDVDDARSADP
jgi:O-antigen ligase